MAGGEGAGTDDAAIAGAAGSGAVVISACDQVAVEPLFRRPLQHLGREVDRVDLAREAHVRAGRSARSPVPAPTSSTGPPPPGRNEGRGDMGGQAILHLRRQSPRHSSPPSRDNRRRQSSGARRAKAACQVGSMSVMPALAPHGPRRGNQAALAPRRAPPIVAAMSTLLSLGHGYSARALARRLIPQGWRVIGTTRNPAKAERPARRGGRAAALARRPWPRAGRGDAYPRLRRAGCGGRPVPAGGAAQIAAAPAALGRLSVHHRRLWRPSGRLGGRGHPADPRSRTAAASACWPKAQWQATGLPLHIFRLAGIYGPGRGPFEKVRDGTARRIIKPGQVFSRIHVDDIAQVLEASIRQPAPRRGLQRLRRRPRPARRRASPMPPRLLGLPRPARRSL